MADVGTETSDVGLDTSASAIINEAGVDEGAGEITPTSSLPIDQPQQPTKEDAEAFIQRMLAEENQVPKKDEPLVEEKLPEGLDPKGGAAQRIQALANSRREAEQRAKAFEQQTSQLQQQVQQIGGWAQQQVQQAQQQNVDLRTQLAELKGQMQIMAQHLNPQAQQPDDATRLKNEWLGEAKNVFNDVLSPIQRENAQLKEQFTNYLREQEVGRLTTQTREAATSATMDVALKGIPNEAKAQLAPMLLPQILAVQMHTGVDAAAAARIVRQTHLNFGLAMVRAHSKSAADALAKGKQVPSVGPSNRRTNGAGNAIPTLKQIQAAGYENELDPEFMRRVQ